MFSAFANHRNT
jgi:NADH dehydrogenase (ubiquinone) flavoprotein 2